MLAGIGPTLGHGVKLALFPALGANSLGTTEIYFHELRQACGVIRKFGLELLESIFHGFTLTCGSYIAPHLLAVKGYTRPAAGDCILEQAKWRRNMANTKITDGRRVGWLTK